MVPKRRFLASSRRVITQKKEEFCDHLTHSHSYRIFKFSVLFCSCHMSTAVQFFLFCFTNPGTWIENAGCQPLPSSCQAFKTVELQLGKVFTEYREKGTARVVSNKDKNASWMDRPASVRHPSLLLELAGLIL